MLRTTRTTNEDVSGFCEWSSISPITFRRSLRRDTLENHCVRETQCPLPLGLGPNCPGQQRKAEHELAKSGARAGNARIS